MVKTYYRSEYSDKQWKALIDKAAELGCQVTYSRYGDRVEIDSTDRENAVLQSTNKSVDDCAARSFWAEHIHQMLQEAAEHEQECLERTTGFEWIITVIPE